MDEEAFNLERYESILKSAINHGFKMDFPAFEGSEKKLLLRHDIDFYLEESLQLAILERKYNATAVYCIQVESELYSLEDTVSRSILDELFNMGHVIALHYNPGYEKKSFVQQIKALEIPFEKKMNVQYFSQHQPTIYGFKNIATENKYTDLYDFMRFDAFTYSSDSCMKSRNKIEELIESEQKIQFLTHPEFWTSKCKNLEEFREQLLRLYGQGKIYEIMETIETMRFTLENRVQIDKKVRL